MKSEAQPDLHLPDLRIEVVRLTPAQALGRKRNPRSVPRYASPAQWPSSTTTLCFIQFFP